MNEARLQQVLQAHWREDAELLSLQRLTAGAAAQTYKLSVSSGGNRQELILRAGHGGVELEGALNKSQEFALLQGLNQTQLPIPQVLFALDEAERDIAAEGFFMHCLEGETLPQKILRDDTFGEARKALTAQCAEFLAQLHGEDPGHYPDLPRYTTAQYLDHYEQLYRQFDYRSPALEIALAWLRDQAREHRPRLVHGDFRNGNIMVKPQGLHAVLDWELSHIGDAAEDLGWLCVNAWRFGRREQAVGGFGRREELLEHYNATAPEAISNEQLHYWEVFGVWRWAIICLYQCSLHLLGQDRSLERLAIGRRLSECEVDLFDLLQNQTIDSGKIAKNYQQRGSTPASVSLSDINQGLEDFAAEASGYELRIAEHLQALRERANARSNDLDAEKQRAQQTFYTSIAEQTAIDSGLLSRLMAQALDQLAVDNPRYSSYKAYRG